MRLLYCLISFSFLSSSTCTGRAIRGIVWPPKVCRCVPAQWEGTLSTVEREFDWTARGAMDRETSVRVHYDYQNRRFATTDLETGVKSIIDYNRGTRYRVDTDGPCHVASINQEMTRMCLPENSRIVHEYRVALGIPVTVWEAKLPGNVTLRTTVLKNKCMPLSEETFIINEDYAALTSSTYVNVSYGIRNETVFDLPLGCTLKKAENTMENEKEIQ